MAADVLRTKEAPKPGASFYLRSMFQSFALVMVVVQCGLCLDFRPGRPALGEGRLLSGGWE